MSALATEVEEQIDALLAAPTFSLEPAEHRTRLLALLKSELTTPQASEGRSLNPTLFGIQTAAKIIWA